MPTLPEVLIDQLARHLDAGDREPFRRSAEDALAELPIQGDGASYRCIEGVWRRYFRPLTNPELHKYRGRPSILQRIDEAKL